MRFLFGDPPPKGTEQPYWPAIEDGRHGFIPGLRSLPECAGMNDAAFELFLQRTKPEKRAVEGFDVSKWDGVNPPQVWCVGGARLASADTKGASRRVPADFGIHPPRRWPRRSF